MREGHGGHWLEREDVGGTTVVRIKVPRFRDDQATQEIFQQIYTLVDLGRHNLVVNLGPVVHMASQAIGKLVMLNRKTQAAGGRLALCGLSPAVAEVFQITHLDELLGIYPGEAEALRSFA